MEVEETRPKRKSFGSFISPGPYQKPLAIAIPPLTSGIENFRQILLFDGYQFSRKLPNNQNIIQFVWLEPTQQAARRVYHLEDGFVPIVTNHGSALRTNPEPRGITLKLAPQSKQLGLAAC